MAQSRGADPLQEFRKYSTVLSADDLRYVELVSFELMARIGYETVAVSEKPDGNDLAHELDSLRPRLNPGRYMIRSAHEREVREKRLSAIERVLARRLV